MIKRLLFTIASLLTLVGGHFLNRRLDRAVVAFAGFIIIMIGIYYVGFTSINVSAQNRHL